MKLTILDPNPYTIYELRFGIEQRSQYLKRIVHFEFSLIGLLFGVSVTEPGISELEVNIN